MYETKVDLGPKNSPLKYRLFSDNGCIMKCSSPILSARLRNDVSKSNDEVEGDDWELATSHARPKPTHSSFHVVRAAVAEQPVDEQNRYEQADHQSRPSPRTHQTVSKLEKNSVRSLFNGQAMITKRGIIPAAIWIDDPTLTPMVNSILPLHAIHTEVTCSAALPTSDSSACPTAMSDLIFNGDVR